MNDTPPVPAVALDSTELARAMRFAFVTFVLCLSYLSIRASLSIPAYQRIFADMLGGKPLPAITSFVIYARLCFVAVSFLVPAVAAATLFSRNFAQSFYVLGALVIVTLVELIVLFHALSAPLFLIMTMMQGG